MRHPRSRRDRNAPASARFSSRWRRRQTRRSSVRCPGISAQRLPSTVPRIIGQNASLRSAFDGNMSEMPTLAYFMSTVSVLLMLFMNSAMPNIPSASAMISTPSNNSVMPKVKRGCPVSMSDPDDADQKAENRHRDALERRSLRQRRAREQSHQHQRTYFGGPEFERHLDQERRQENHFGDAERGADKGGDDGDAERGAALALLGQRKPVETGHGVRRMTGQIEQDRADRPAILGAIIDAGKHQDRRHRLHPEGQRQQDRDRRDRSHPRQHADQVADQHPEKTIHQVVRLERHAKAVPEIGNRR